MKNFIFLIVFIFIPFLLIAQKGLMHQQVTVLMKNKSKLKGVVKMDFLYSMHLQIGEQTYVLKKNEIIAVIPGDVMLENLDDEVLQKDLLALKNKVWLSGEIIKLDSETVQFKMDTSMHVLPLRQIAKIYAKGQEISILTSLEKDTDYVTPSKLSKLRKQYEKGGIYQIVYGNLATKNNVLEESLFQENGLGLQYVFGYQFTQRFGLGLGVGYLDYFGPNEDRLTLIPLFVEARGYLSKRKTSAYYNLAVGVTAGTKFNEEFLLSRRPGIYTHPAFGYKIGSDRVAFLIDLGVQLSSVEYEFLFPSFSGIPVKNNQVLEARRVVVRLGIMF